MRPCFGYIRVSTARQSDGASLEAQRDAITGFASQNNLTITKWFEEQETASKAGRPIFDAMMKSLRNGDAAGVVIHRIDRSSRNYADWARLDDMSRMGVKIFFAADSLDFDSRGGRLLADIQMALAADYSRNLSLEVKKGIYGRIKHGIFPFRAPLGYLDNGGGNLKSIDPIKGPLVKQAFSLYCSGEYSITSLTKEMRRHGLTGLAGRPVVRRNIETMLRNPFYCGKMLICGKLYDGSHAPLISTAQFQRVKMVKAGRIQKKSTKHQLLFRNLLQCADCRKTLTGERQKMHIYYRCHTADCPNVTIREDRLESQLVAQLQQFQIAQDEQLELKTRLQLWLKSSGTSELESSLKLRIANANTRQDRLTDLLINGTIGQADFEVRKQNTEFELDRLREELHLLTQHQKTESDLGELLELATNLTDLYQSSLPAERRELIRNCIAEATIKQGVLTAPPADWLSTIRAMQQDENFTPRLESLRTAGKTTINLQ